jgi:hypothetical protein
MAVYIVTGEIPSNEPRITPERIICDSNVTPLLTLIKQEFNKIPPSVKQELIFLCLPYRSERLTYKHWYTTINVQPSNMTVVCPRPTVVPSERDFEILSRDLFNMAKAIHDKADARDPYRLDGHEKLIRIPIVFGE